MKISRFIPAFLLPVMLFSQGCASNPADCRLPEVFCVGLVTEVGRLEDHASNQAVWEGLQQAKVNGLADHIASIESVNARDYLENIRVFTDAGYDAIVTVGSGMADVTRSAAQTYSTVYFIGLDQDQTAITEFSPNLAALVFKGDQIGFLAGALAASLSSTKQVGAVCGSESLPEMKLPCDAFVAGAHYIDPQVTATVMYDESLAPSDSLDDPDWGTASAQLLVTSGADILFAEGGTTSSSALIEAVALGAYAVGANHDQYYRLPLAAPHLYASMMKMIPPGIANLIGLARQAQAGTGIFPTGNTIGQVGISSYHDLASAVPDEVKTRMHALTLSLLSGEIDTTTGGSNP
jgi:basic membrane protein A and related proteins